MSAPKKAPAKEIIEVGPRDARYAAGRDPPPSRSFRGADVETAEHDNAGLRIELAAAFERYRCLGKLGDPEELAVAGELRCRTDAAAEPLA